MLCLVTVTFFHIKVFGIEIVSSRKTNKRQNQITMELEIFHSYMHLALSML